MTALLELSRHSVIPEFLCTSENDHLLLSCSLGVQFALKNESIQQLLSKYSAVTCPSRHCDAHRAHRVLFQSIFGRLNLDHGDVPSRVQSR